MYTKFEKIMHKKFQMSSIGELTFFLGLQVTQKDDRIFICQDKYVDETLMKFGFLTIKTVSTPIETLKPLMKEENAKDIDVHLYRLMIGSLMYLTSSRPDIMEYAGASLDKKSTIEDYQFLKSRLISWKCKKKIVVANSTTKTDEIAAMDDIEVNSANAKNINGEAQINAKVDEKKVIISKATIKRDLKFKDYGGVDCLSNEVIFDKLPFMGNENLS
nr:hypothetical protein [Tanacetum cinerariifolium]